MVFSKSLFCISILNLRAVDLEYNAKMQKNREIKEEFVLKHKKIFFKIILKNLDRFLKKSLYGLPKIPLLYLYTKFKRCRPRVQSKDAKK